MKTKHEKIVEVLKERWYYFCGQPRRVHVGHPVDWYEQLDLKTVERFFDNSATAIDQLEPEGEGRIEFDCPECGERLQYGLSQATLEKMKQSRLFTPQQPSEGEMYVKSDEPTNIRASEMITEDLNVSKSNEVRIAYYLKKLTPQQPSEEEIVEKLEALYLTAKRPLHRIAAKAIKELLNQKR